MINGFKTKTIKNKTFGQKLKIARQKKNASLADVEEATKVRERYLVAFETDDFEQLPDEVYAVGFLRRYLQWLGLEEDKYLITFKRELHAWQSVQKYTIQPEKTVKENKIIVTPRIILTTLATAAVLLVVGYISLQVSHLTAPPELVIINPSRTTKVAIEQIEISGKTDPGATVAINEQPITQDKDGNFHEVITLSSGINTIQVVATNRFNKQATQTLTIVKTGGEKGPDNGQTS